MSLFPSPTSLKAGTKSLLSIHSGWFYVQILIFLSSFDLDNIKKHQIVFSSEQMVSTGIFKMYLNESQANYLITNNIAKLSPISRNKLLSSTGDAFLIKAIPNWTPPEGSWITGRITDSIYTVSGATYSQLMRDERVLSAEELPDAQTTNRYDSGYIQSGSENLGYFGKYFESDKIANRNGLDGKGQIITILDSGLDYLHPFFRDRDRTVPINKTDLSQRKLVRYDAKIDDFDEENGHGTHVCGTALGNPDCDSCGLKMYSGIAPEAKLYFVDQAMSNGTDNDISVNIDWSSIIKNMRNMGSYITSNSWGFPFQFHSFTEAYDKLAYETPDILHVFAAGNIGREMAVHSPGDSKNILTVGAVTAPRSRLYDNIKTKVDAPRIAVLKSDDFEVTLFTRGLDIWNLSFDKPDYIPINVEVVNYDPDNLSSVENNIVNFESKKIIEDHCSFVQKLKSNMAYALIYSGFGLKCKDEAVLKDYIIARYENSNKDDVNEMITLSKKVNISFAVRSADEQPDIGVASFSSKGPTWSSVTKPDISAPGENTISSCSGDPFDTSFRSSGMESLSNKSGTSMATPSISGSAALVRQFFSEKYYPTFKKGTGREINLSSSLLKAMLIDASTNLYSFSSSAPDNSMGYGTPVLADIFGYNGVKLRVIDNQKIDSNSHHVYKITVTNNKKFSVVMSYLDPPVNEEKANIIFADLDLYVTDPNGNVRVGNIRPRSDEYDMFSDSFATNEKVAYQTSELLNGEYTIHVTSSIYPMKMDIKYALVISGDFDDSTPDPIPMTIGTDCPSNCYGNGKCVKGQCQCNKGFAGFNCKAKVVSMGRGVSYLTEVLKDNEIAYYSVDVHDPVSKDYPMNLYFSGVRIKPVACFSKKMGKISNPDWKCIMDNDGPIKYIPEHPIFNREPIYIAVYQAGRKIASFESNRIKFLVNTTHNDLTPTPPQSITEKIGINPSSEYNVQPTPEKVKHYSSEMKEGNQKTSEDKEENQKTSEIKEETPLIPEKKTEIPNKFSSEIKYIKESLTSNPVSEKQEVPKVSDEVPNENESNEKKKEKIETIGIAVGASIGGVIVIAIVIVSAIFIKKHYHFKKLQDGNNQADACEL